MLLIEGLPDVGVIIRDMLEKEYAFQISYPGYVVKIAFHKGTWLVWKTGGGYFELCDSGVSEADDPVLKALLGQICRAEIGEVTESSMDFSRQLPAKVIQEALKSWAGKMEEIKGIQVLQPGRDASIDKKTGKFELSNNIF
jgi:hypothetical protein